MKKLVILMLVLCTVLSLPCAAVSAAVGVQKIPDGVETIWYDNWICLAHEVYITVDHLLDLSVYNGVDVVDFHGVQIVNVIFDGKYHTPESDLADYGRVTYTVILEDSVKLEDAIAILEADGTFLNVEPVDLAFPDGEESVALGDVNLNGEIDSRDYVLLKRAYFGTYKLDTTQSLAADVSGNGAFDSRDYVLLKRAYFGTYKIGTGDDGLTE